MRKVLSYLKPFVFWIILSVVLLGVKSLADLVLPNYMADIVDTGIINYGYEGVSADELAQITASGADLLASQQSYIIKIGLKMIGVTLLGILAAIGLGIVGARVGAGLGRNLRLDIFKRVQSFSAYEYNKFGAASLITRTTNDVTQIQSLLIVGIQVAFLAPIMGVGGIVMILLMKADMAWILGVGCLCILFIILAALFFVLPKFTLIQKLTDKLTLISRENLTGLMVSRAFRTEKHEAERFDKANRELIDTNHSIFKTVTFLFPSLSLLMNLLSLLIIWVGAGEIANSSVEVGKIMAFMQYTSMVIMAFIMVSMMFAVLPRASVSARRIAEVLEIQPSIKNPSVTKPFDPAKKGMVEFKNVSFGYEGAADKVLDGISFVAKPGEMTAFIGSTGSGKSTLINLIPRFYDVTEGQVLVEGVDVRDADLNALHAKIGYVPQKGSLFSGTIASNLKYGNRDADDEFMEKCAKIAQAEEFILEKEDKYSARVSQGAKNVSGGQKQRISIARALVTNAPIYVFDDSFSALDMKTDALLRAALKKHITDATILVVAQRVSTIMNAEQIIVLDEGKMVGKGTHRELLKSCPQYYEIAASQLSGEELENA